MIRLETALHHFRRKGIDALVDDNFLEIPHDIDSTRLERSGVCYFDPVPLPATSSAIPMIPNEPPILARMGSASIMFSWLSKGTTFIALVRTKSCYLASVFMFSNVISACAMSSAGCTRSATLCQTCYGKGVCFRCSGCFGSSAFQNPGLIDHSLGLYSGILHK